jgi:hypothetical protein
MIITFDSLWPRWKNHRMKLTIKSELIKSLISWFFIMFMGTMYAKVVQPICGNILTFILFFPAWIHIIKPTITEIDKFLDS